MKKTVRLVIVVSAAAGLFLSSEACHRKPKITSALEQDQVRSAEEWLREEPVRLLRDYVRLDTRGRGPGERKGAEFLRDLLDCAGLETEIVCPAPERCNVLARLRGRSRQGALLLVNHIDDAEVVPSTWIESKPFEGKIRLGYLYGRGTYDMKSIGIAQALAVADLARRGIVPPSDILFLGEADEETGQKWGARWLLEHRPEWFAGVTHVLNEGGANEMILRDVRFWGIETVLAGYAFVEFEAASAEPLTALAGRWKSPGAPIVDPLPVVVRSFDMLANHLNPPLTGSLRHLDEVRKNPAELASLPDRYGAFLEPRIFWSPTSARDAQGRIRIYTVISTPPGLTPDSFVSAIERDAAAAGIRTAEAFSTGATRESPYPTPFTDALARVTQAVYPQVSVGPLPTYGGATTSIYFRDRGIPTYGFSTIAMNITDAVRRHGIDERIFLRDFLNGVGLYREIVAEVALNP
jgi:acetylornithine deacetylase/succinyl-diaminopimelate desuccinylase-like protein